MAKPIMHPFRIWYDGLDADRHQMDAELLGESLQGLGRILRVSTHFALLRQHNKRRDASCVKIVVQPPKPGTWWCDALVVLMSNYSFVAPVIDHYAREIVMKISLVTLLRKSNRPELYHEIANDALQLERERWKEERDLYLEIVRTQTNAISEMALKRDAQVDKLLDALIESNQIAAAQAVKPVGATCCALALGDAHKKPEELVHIDESMAESIRDKEQRYCGRREYTILFDGITLHNGSCRFQIVGEAQEFVHGEIADVDELRRARNKYTAALNNREPLTVFAEAVIHKGKLRLLDIE